ncbi:MAG: hypothetical protein WBA13_15240 [Microcoleaceae cyanobacterium]
MAIASRCLFHDLLFIKLIAQSPILMLEKIFFSLLIISILIGYFSPLSSLAISRSLEKTAFIIGLLYGINTLELGR